MLNISYTVIVCI